jgi:hypothetical protein
MTAADIAAHARALLDANGLLTLGTVDPAGRPWTSPVYFAASGFREFYWSSETDAVHSCNLTERPHVSIVVFDSSVRPYHGRALYANLAGDHADHSTLELPSSASVLGRGSCEKLRRNTRLRGVRAWRSRTRPSPDPPPWPSAAMPAATPPAAH